MIWKNDFKNVERNKVSKQVIGTKLFTSIPTSKLLIGEQFVSKPKQIS